MLAFSPGENYPTTPDWKAIDQRDFRFRTLELAQVEEDKAAIHHPEQLPRYQ